MPVPHYSTGLKTLDALIGDPCPGIPREGLTIIVGGTGSGKSSLCQIIATQVATHHVRGASAMGIPSFRVGLANIEEHVDPGYHPYDVLRLQSMDELAITVLRSTYDLLIIDGVQYLDMRLDPSDQVRQGIAASARYLEALFARTQASNTTLVFTWQSRRGISSSDLSTPSGISYRASLIIQLEERGRLVRVVKNKFGDSGGVCEFGDRWTEKEPPEPEFDRSKIPTRFEREDVI